MIINRVKGAVVLITELTGTSKAFNTTKRYTFGFEYEAISRNGMDIVRNLIKKYYNGGTVGFDESVKGRGSPFEFSSPILQFNKHEIVKLIHFIEESWKAGIYTNRTCGFHIHISFPDYSKEDGELIICNIAMSDSFRKTIERFKGFKFVDYFHAENTYLDSLKQIITNGGNPSNLLTDEKERTFRLHPQGTLEWRGPRNFMNKQKIIYIFKFIKLLGNYISFIDNVLNNKGLVTKQDYERLNMEPSFTFWANGNKKSESYMINKRFQYHRLDGPAFQSWFSDGSIQCKIYWVNGKTHREDGPAYIEYSNDGSFVELSYYINNKELHETDYFNLYHKNIIASLRSEHDINYKNYMLSKLREFGYVD